MKNLETKLIKFNEDELLGVQDENGQLWLAIKKTMKDIGLTEDQAKRQQKNLKDDIVLSKGVAYLTLLTNGGEQQTYCIKEDFVTLWLAKISITPKMQEENPQAVEKLVNYQLKCAKVLHEAFFKTEEQKQNFSNEMGLKGEIVDLKTTINKLENKIDTMETTMGTMINSATINSFQAKQLNKLARERISIMLGGAHSKVYKEKSRMYFKNIWLNLCDEFQVNEYRELNPLNYSSAVTFVTNWSFNG